MAYSALVLAVRRYTSGRGDQWGHMLGSWYRQANDGKTDTIKCPLSGRLSQKRSFCTSRGSHIWNNFDSALL